MHDLTIEHFIPETFAQNPEQFYAIKHFLKQHKEASANRTDWISVLKTYPPTTPNILGISRLMPVKISMNMPDDLEQNHQAAFAQRTLPPVFWLRGVYVQPEYRQQSLGSQLITAQQAFVTNRFKTQSVYVYAFAQQALEGFYKKLNFQVIPSSDLPDTLALKFESYQIHKPDLIALKWQSCHLS